MILYDYSSIVVFFIYFNDISAINRGGQYFLIHSLLDLTFFPPCKSRFGFSIFWTHGLLLNFMLKSLIFNILWQQAHLILAVSIFF